MAMSDLINAKQAQARDNELQVLQAAAAAGDEGITTAEAAAATALAERTVRQVMGRLETQRMVVRGKSRRWLATPAGTAEAGAGMPGLAMTDALDAALGMLPAEPMKAFARLLLSGVVARHHLRWRDGSGWSDGFGSFVAAGPTKTGKTALAKMVCQAFGFVEAQTIRNASAETPLSLWGRRVQQPGVGWVLEPADTLGRPFLCIDEFDKAPAELRGRLIQLGQGDALAAGEGDQLLEVAPTVLFCLNGGPGDLHEAYRRRSVVLDLEPLTPLLDDVHKAMRQLLSGAVPRLQLDRLAPPAAELDDDDRDLLHAALRQGLTDHGWRWTDERAVESLALGRAGLTRSDLATAAAATAADYLSCARTVGEARPGIPPVLAERLAGSSSLLPVPVRAEVELSRRAEVALRKEQEDLQVIAAREACAEHLHLAHQAILQVPKAHRPTAAGLRKVLKKLRERVLDQRSAEGLTEVWSMAEPVMEQAEELAELVERERQQERQDKARQVQEAAQARAFAQDQRRRRAQGEKDRKALERTQSRWRSQRRAQLQSLYRRKRLNEGEDWVKVLVDAGVIERRERQEQYEAGYVSDLWRRPENRNPRRVMTRTVVEYFDQAGHAHTRESLARPGTPAVRQAIEASAQAAGVALQA
jgi:hypothetical protein